MELKAKELSLLNTPEFRGRESIVIGCGGIGTSVVDHLKGLLSEYVDLNQFHGVKLLALDTAQQDRGTRQTTLDNEVVRVFSQDLRKTADSLGSLSHIAEWFPDPHDSKTGPNLTKLLLDEIPNSMDGAATTRPFGRVGLFENAQAIFDKLARLISLQAETSGNDRYGKPMKTMTLRKDIYIAASLGGGTGSGTFLDVAAMVRKLQSEAHEKWYISGVFVLPELLYRDERVPRRFQSKIRANGYAALKELDHFLHGNPFSATYGKGMEHELRLNQESHFERLFNMIYLLDRKNIRNCELITSRDEMAEMIARMLFYLTMTEAGANFYTRYPDNRANQIYAEQRPSGAWGQDRDRRRTLYSTFGLATLEIPVDKLARYSSLQLALDVHRYLWEGDAAPVSEDAEVENEVNTLRKELNLTPEAMGELFDPLRRLPEFPSDEDLIHGTLWLPRNRRAAIEELSQRLQAWQKDATYLAILDDTKSSIRTELNRICGTDEATGRMEEAIDHLIETQSQAAAMDVCEQLEEDIDGLIEQTRIDLREAETASSDPAVNGMAGIEETRSEFLLNPPGRNIFLNVFDGLRKNIDSYRVTRFAPMLLNQKIAYLNSLRIELERRRRNLSDIERSHRQVRSELRRLQKGIDFSSTPFHRLIFDAAGAHDFHTKFVVPRLTKDEKPQTIAEDIRTHGLKVSDKTIKLDDWEDWAPDLIARALWSRVSPIVEIEPDEDIYGDATEQGAKSLWRLDFDDLFFKEGGDRADDFSRFTEDLLYYGAESLHYDQSDMVNQRLRIVFSGSRQNGRLTWPHLIGKSDMQMIPGRQPNQVTLLNFRMGFTLYSLGFIEDWERRYQTEHRRGMPLHLFKDAYRVFREPYFPLAFERENDLGALFNALLQYGVISQTWGKDEYGLVAKEKYFPHGHNVFYLWEEHPLAYSEGDLSAKLQNDSDFNHAFLKALNAQASDLPEDLKSSLNREQMGDASQIIAFAFDKRLLEEGSNGLIYPDPPPGLEPYFVKSQERKRSLTRQDFIKALDENDSFYLEIFDELIDAIIIRFFQDRHGVQLKYKRRDFPDTVMTELERFLRSVG